MNLEDESVNIPELCNQVERQIAGGVHGIFPFGTNGEAYILSMKEKEEILEATVDQVKGRIPVYAGTGCISTRDTVYLSKRAEEMGLGGYDMIVALDISGDNYWLIQGNDLRRDFTDSDCSDYAYEYMEYDFARGMYGDALLDLTEALEIWYGNYFD